MLEIQQLNSGYDEVKVLRDFSAHIPTGKITALMGRNGMGKTTLLKTMMGLLPTQSGRILLGGDEIQSLTTYQIARSGLGYVPQGREVFDDFTVYENLKLAGLGSNNVLRDILPQIYGWFPILEERAEQKAGTFSGGQQQILAIARALVTRPKILLLDEPSEGIQPSIVHEIALKLSEIARDTNLTVLLVEQNVDMVRQMADEVTFMENGMNKETYPIDAIANDDSLLHQYLGV